MQDVRDEIRIANHGGDLLAFARRYGKKEEEILDFSSSINPLGPSPAVVTLYGEIHRDLARYPDPYGTPFREAVSDRYGLPCENVIVANGSFALLELALRAISPRRAILAEPSFTEYRRLLELNGVPIQSIVLDPKEDFHFPAGEILESLSAGDLLLLGHPNNPTGTALSVPELNKIVGEAERLGVFIILDEAFADWSPEISLASEAWKKNHLLVIRSLTKFYSLAGIRSGFAIGPLSLLERMTELQGPWTCNRIAQKLSMAALCDMEFTTKTREWFESERLWFRAALQDLKIFKVFPTLANFFLIESKFPVHDLKDFLGERGIYVRFFEGVQELQDHFFRAAIRRREENKHLIEALTTWKEIQRSVGRP